MTNAVTGRKPQRSAHRTTPERCAELGHPGVTYNSWHDVTACLCGARWQEGNQAVPHIACCGGPLSEPLGGDQ